VRAVAALAVMAVSLPNCGGSSANSRLISVCQSTEAHSTTTPVTGRIYAFGGPKVEIEVDNTGNLGHGQAILGTTDYPGWSALRTHFFTPPSYTGPFSVGVKGIEGSGVAGIGPTPPGGAINEPAGPAQEASHGWREWPAFTWVKSPGCYVFTISGPGFVKHVTIAGLGR